MFYWWFASLQLFINDLILFWYTRVLSNYADDNNLYAIGNNKEETKKALSDLQTVINWFHENDRILNTGKCHYMCMGKDVDENETLLILSQKKKVNSKEVEILGTKIDQILSFHQRIKSISKITGKKISALLRTCPYLPLHKKCLYLELFWSVFFPHSDWIRTRITPNTDTFYAVLKIKKVVYNTIIKFQFNYGLLVWMSLENQTTW